MITEGFWLLKTEPSDFSWSDMVSCGVSTWDGVRNPQAQSFLRKMSLNELAFFYHTGSERRILGVVKVIKCFYLDQEDNKFGSVDVEFHHSLDNPVSLRDIKHSCSLQNMMILKQPRLSVSRVTNIEWNTIMQLSKSAYRG